MSQISFKYNFEVFACSTFLHTPPPEFTWIAVKFCDSRHFYPYPWIHVHCNAFWWILVTYRTSTPPPEFTCNAMHFGEFLWLIALLPLPLNSRAMQCILWNFPSQRTPTPAPEFTCNAMHFGEFLWLIALLPLYLNSRAMQCILWNFPTQRTPTPTLEYRQSKPSEIRLPGAPL